ITTLKNDVAIMNSNSDGNTMKGGQRLNLHRALYSIYNTIKDGKTAITVELHYIAVIYGSRHPNVFPVIFNLPNGGRLIVLKKVGVPFDVSNHHSYKFADGFTLWRFVRLLDISDFHESRFWG